MTECILNTKHFTATFEDTPELRDAVFEKLIAFYAEHESYSGESIMQSDNPQIYAPVLLSEIADDLIKFKVDYE